MADTGLVAALARAQANFGVIKKSHENPHFKSQYADIADVLEAVRPVLAAEGIAVVQPIEVTEMGTVLVTKLMLGAETLESRFVLPIENLDAQRVGSWVTYMRRFCLCSLVGVHPVGDDDDGNLAATAQTAPAGMQAAAVAFSKSVGAIGDPYVLAAATRPEKPLAAMTAGEMARYGESIGVRVSGNKSDILRQLEPYVKAAEGTEPFGLDGERTAPRDDPHDKLFEPVVAAASSIGDEPQ